jgi:hypothetical protein
MKNLVDMLDPNVATGLACMIQDNDLSGSKLADFIHDALRQAYRQGYAACQGVPVREMSHVHELGKPTIHLKQTKTLVDGNTFGKA